MTVHRTRLHGLVALLVAVQVAAACGAPAQIGVSPASTATPVVSPVVMTSTPTRPAPTDTPLPTAMLDPTATPVVAAGPASATPEATPGTVPISTYQVVAEYPHDTGAFTEGLVYRDGELYEGTGLRGQSYLRQVDLETGQVIRELELADQYFGEGVAVLGDKIYELTWQENVGFVYDRDTFELLGTWNYSGEGWGLTDDGQRLIMSDGTDTLRFLDPETLAQVGSVRVHDASGPVVRINELEYIDGQVYANIWLTDWVARIDPDTGQVVGWIDLSGLLDSTDLAQPVDVLNGIAYDAAGDRIYVTGKLWP